METNKKWHPIMQAREYEAGKWVMFDSLEHPYALIDIVRRGDEVGYKVTTWKQDPASRKLIGYFKTLAASADKAHSLWIDRGVPHGAANARPDEIARIYADLWS